MADALVSIVLDRLVSVIQQQIHHPVSLAVGVDAEVQSLTNTLQTIRSVLADAEKRQVNDHHVRLWLQRLKDMAYQIDDVVDEWSTAILKSHIEGLENASIPMKKKISSFFPSSCIPFKQVASRHEIAVKIQSIKQRLDEIENERNRFNFSSSDRSEESNRSVTTSTIDNSETCGRDADKEIILNKLLGHENRQLLVISIVGMGGIGKTTLAQLVYNHPAVESHFRERIWVFVPHPFEPIKVCRAIVESLQNLPCNLHELETAQRKIQTCISGKKFLLVLDDVWTEEYRLLEQLKNFLKCGAEGSCILVTTRNMDVAKKMESTYTHTLQKLSDYQCLSLFNRVAFSGRNSDKIEEVREIGEKIASKCGGLPLAIKTIGSMLLTKDSIEEWESILNSRVWQMDVIEKHISPPLLLSYYDLSSPIKRCFSFCATFPKNHIIRKENLIRLWMAHGYLNSGPIEDSETTGECYFHALLGRSFFQNFAKDEDGKIISCRMHDIMHDLAQFLTKNECLIMEVDEEGEVRKYPPSEKGHHATLIGGSNGVLSSCICDMENLHTLLNWGGVRITAASDNLFQYLACLRALDLSWNNSIRELPRGLGKLIHLRYLNLSWCWILKELPEGICDLCNLQTLDVSGCRELDTLPQGMGKLINLRHLANEGTNFRLPKEFERLTSLRTLCKLISSKDDNACKIGNLRNLNMLRGSLEIRRLDNVEDGGEAEKAELKKKHLHHLTLSDGRRKSVIDALQPHPNLKSLEIKWYNDIEYPSWMMNSYLTQLKTLQLNSCYKVERMPPLGELPRLKILGIRNIDNLKYMGDEFLGSTKTTAFPKLEELDFVFMEVWEKWQIKKEENRSIMPSLRSLKISYCPTLKSLPDCLLRGTILRKINHCPLLHYTEEGGED